MASSPIHLALRSVHRLFGAGTVVGLSEGQLLERFVARRDEAAFEALVARHGPMVLGVCRRVLRDPHAADDAFQATFLILVRRAGSIQRGEALGPWLHRVARRVAIEASRGSARRGAGPIEVEVEASRTEEPSAEASLRELRAALHEELDRLPVKYRAPLVLCYLEGLSHEQAARELAWPVGSVKGRLARARELLRARLTRRGVAVPAGALATAIGAEATAAVPSALLDATVAAALRFAAGRAATAGAAAGAGLLAEGVLRSLLMTKLKAVGAAVMVAGLTIGAATFPGLGARGLAGTDGEGAARAGKPADGQAAADESFAALQGFWERTSIKLLGGDPNAVEHPLHPTILIRGHDLWFGDPRPGANPKMRLAFMDASRDVKKLNLVPVIGMVGNEKGTDYIGDPGKALRSICRLEGDALTIRLPLGPGDDRPRDFDSAEDAATYLLTYRRRTTPPAAAESEERDLDRLKGVWALKRRVRGGKVEEESDLGANTELMRFLGRSVLFAFRGKTAGEMEVRLDPSRSPKTIELRRISTEPGAKVPKVYRGIYRLEGDRLTLCAAANNTETAPLPTGFESTAANGWIVNEFVRRDAAPEERGVLTLRDLQGQWAAVSSEVGGRSHAIDWKQGEGLWLTIRDDRAEFEGVNPPVVGKRFVALFILKEPTAIDFREDDLKAPKPEGQPIRGIVRRRGDELTLCLAGKEDDERPREFATRPGDGRRLIVFRRDEQAPEPPVVKADARGADAPDDPRAAMKKWSEARLKAARERLDAQKTSYENGTITIDRYLDAARRLMEAQIAAGGSAADRRAAIRTYVDLTREILKREQAKFKVGAASVPNLAEAEEINAEAEFRLAQEEAGPKAEGPDAAGKRPDEAAGAPGVRGAPMSSDRLSRLLEETRLSASFRDARLDAVLRHISASLRGPRLPEGLPIYIDPIALGEKGIGTEAKVTFRVRELAVPKVLDMVLDPLGLTYTVRDGLVLIEGPSSERRRSPAGGSGRGD